uniref:AIG1-type G domain-containing protein n=1 Tax=Rhizophagus irregularis (strain DAOM 181602 / DAOM 197198 / MUCL 43194) TaxID=747089 RepID=U9T6R6_RHIID
MHNSHNSDKKIYDMANHSQNDKLTSLDISSCPKDIELIKPTDLKVIEKEEKIVKIKNILIIGCTGSGKSTLASVLTETEGFKESEYGVSKTKHFKKGVFEWKGTKYRVIDTTGVGSTGLSTKKVSNRIAEGIFSVPLSEGINQVLLVVEVIIRINKGTRKKSRTILLDHLEKVCQEEVLHMEYDASTNATGAIQPPNSDTEITDDDNTYVDYSTDDENTRPDHFTSLPSLPQPITINHRELQPYHITKIAIKGKKIAMNFIKIPKVNLSDKFYLKMIRPSTKLEVGLISSNIFPIENLGSFPFIKIDDNLNDTSTDTEKDIIDVDLHVCIPLTSYKSLRIDNNKERIILIEVLGKPVKDIPRQNSNKYFFPWHIVLKNYFNYIQYDYV